jgi:hypothetical protein
LNAAAAASATSENLCGPSAVAGPNDCVAITFLTMRLRYQFQRVKHVRSLRVDALCLVLYQN